jgi:hypothetical protein
MEKLILKNQLKNILLSSLTIILIGFILIFFIKEQELRRLIFVIVPVFVIVSFFAIIIRRGDSYWSNIGIIVGFSLTIIGWFLNSYWDNQNQIKNNKLSNINSVINEQRQFKVKYLIDCYIKIEECANRDSEPFLNTFYYYKNIEPSIGMASLLGDSLLVKKINDFAMTDGRQKKKYNENYMAVLYELRKNIRKELGLAPLPDNISSPDSNYNIVFYRRFITDSMAKQNPDYYNKLQIEIAQDLIKSNFRQ